MQKRDLAARIIGLLVFALGIVILLFSFYAAYQLFSSPTAGIAVTPSAPNGAPATVNLGRSALFTVIKIGALFIMVLVGSLTASRGVQMYFAGERVTKVEE